MVDFSLTPSWVTRGSTVEVIVNFLDDNGNRINPASATLHVSYSVAGVKTTVSLPMSSASEGWGAIWDSTPADYGTATWFAQSSAIGGKKGAAEGTLVIRTNDANVPS